MGRHIKFDMKKILVTGSKGLIGKKVIINLKKKYKVEGIDIKDGLDLNNELQVEKFFKKNNNFNVLINLHGANEHVVSSKKDDFRLNKKFKNDKSYFDYFFQNNVFSFYVTSKYFLKYCKKAEGIVNFSSIFGIRSPKHYIYENPKNIFYVSSKFAVSGITKYFATMYGKKVNVNTIANHGIEWKQSKKFKKKLLSNIPKNRMMKVEDLYGILDLLCSGKGNFINGSTIVIDGGYSSW
jgi:3-oxoacyl-[acyl-carrier protein] reductase